MPPQPEVRVDTPENICAFVKRKPDCTAYGYFDKDGIVISNELDLSTKVDASKLLHEMVHYLQDQHEGPTTDCLMYVEREREAYKIQAYVLMRDGEYLAAGNLQIIARGIHCVDPGQ